MNDFSFIIELLSAQTFEIIIQNCSYIPVEFAKLVIDVLTRQKDADEKCFFFDLQLFENWVGTVNAELYREASSVVENKTFITLDCCKNIMKRDEFAKHAEFLSNQDKMQQEMARLYRIVVQKLNKSFKR